MKQKLLTVKRKEAWSNQLNLTAHSQVILDHATKVLRLSKIVFCKVLVCLETSTKGSWKGGSAIKFQKLWALSFLQQTHHVHYHPTTKLHCKDSGEIFLSFTIPRCICLCHIPLHIFWSEEMIAGAQTHF